MEGIKETLTHILKIVVFTGVLVITSVFQLGYIEYNETPYITGCIHYDTHGNEIYISKARGICPTLHIIEMTDTTLQFEVEEVYHVIIDSFKFDADETTQYDNVEITTNYLTTTLIQYDSMNRISEVKLNSSLVNVINAENRKESLYRSYSNIIKNNYDNKFEQIINTASIIEPFNDSNKENITHASFQEDEYQTITYYTEDTLSGLEQLLYKEYLVEDELVTEEITRFSYSLIGGIKTFNMVAILNDIPSIQQNTDLEITNETVTIVDYLDGDYSDSTITSIYQDNDKYGYLKESRNSIVEEGDTIRNNQTSFTLSEIDDKDYVISHFSSDMDFNFTIEDDIYKLEETTYGMIVHYLAFHNDSYFYNLGRKDIYETSIFMYYRNTEESTSIFDISYSMKYPYIDKLVYTEPKYLSFD